jgi:hypothetical protein
MFRAAVLSLLLCGALWSCASQDEAARDKPAAAMLDDLRFLYWDQEPLARAFYSEDRLNQILGPVSIRWLDRMENRLQAVMLNYKEGCLRKGFVKRMAHEDAGTINVMIDTAPECRLALKDLARDFGLPRQDDRGTLVYGDGRRGLRVVADSGGRVERVTVVRNF